MISAVSIINVPLKGFVVKGTDLTGVTGTSTVVTTEMTGKTPSGGSTSAGVVVTAPYNKVVVRATTSVDPIEDGSGNQVYARITESSGVWTLSYFVDISGTETAYNFSSTNISWWYQELFNPLAPTAPVYDESFVYPSDNAREDVPDATSSTRGLISAGAQSIGGDKTFVDDVILNDTVSTNRLDVATSATINALSTAKSFINFTGSTATQLNGATAGTDGQHLTIHNESSADVVVNHQSGSASATDRFLLPNATDITIGPDSSAEFIYSTSQSRWVQKSGSGSGGSQLYQEGIGTADGIATSFGPLTYLPSNEDSVAVYVNYVLEDKANWSLSGSNIVFSSAPADASQIYVVYGTNGLSSLPTPTGILKTEFRTLTAPEAAAEKIVLLNSPLSGPDILVDVIGGTAQEYSVDYTVVGNEVRWNGLGLTGLAAGDKLRVFYQY